LEIYFTLTRDSRSPRGIAKMVLQSIQIKGYKLDIFGASEKESLIATLTDLLDIKKADIVLAIKTTGAMEASDAFRT
jgi:hypothetical protein